MATLSDLAMRILISAEDQTGPGFKKTADGIQSISSQLQRLESFAKTVVDVRLFAGWVQEGITLADAYKTLQGRLQLVSDNTREFSNAQTELFGIAQRSRSSLEGTYAVYGKIETVIKQLGGTQEQAFKTTETLNQAIALTSQGMEQDKAAILQFSQALASGVLRGDEFNSVMENSPGLAQALADGLGVPITKLRSMAEAGQLTADQLVNALGNSAPKIAEQFSKLPVTVSGAMTQVNNALLNFVGHSDAANIASTRLAGLLQGLANNFSTVANIAETVATIYAVRMVAGWAKSAQAAVLAASSAREKAAADVQAQQAAIALLQTENQLAIVRVKVAQAMVAEAQLQKALAVGTEQQAVATKALTVALNGLHAAQTKSTAAQTALSGRMGDVAEKSTGLAKSTQLLGSAFNGLFSAWMAFDAGKTLGDWLMQFDAVRVAGSYLAETLVMIKTGSEGMINGMSFSERWQQLKQIHSEFEQIRAAEAIGAQSSAQTVQQTEELKAQAVQQAALKQQEAFAKVQEATKALTAQIDADAKAQTASIQQALAEKLIAIDASDQLDTQKDAARLQVKLLAAQQELALQQATATTKLQLIDQEYAKELQSAQGHADRVNQIETDKRQAKLSVYRGVAEFYQSEVSRLTEIYGQETQAFAQAQQSLETLATDHQQRLVDIERQGMSDRQKAQSEELEFNQTLSALKAELAKGDAASQSTINELMNRAKTLQNDITQAAISGADEQTKKSTAIYEAKKRENELYDLQKTILEANSKAHAENAAAAQQALEGNKQKLEETKSLIDGITEQLSKDYALKIGIDQQTLSDAQQVIADLVKPETKVITIQTVDNSGGGSGAAQQATGGPAGRPTGQPWRFANGGWARMAGLLSGYGGGDRRKALLEDGEFIIRKEAVKKLGVDTLYAINSGELPLQRSAGGGVNLDEEWRKKGIDALKKLLEQAAVQPVNRFLGWNVAGDSIPMGDTTKGFGFAAKQATVSWAQAEMSKIVEKYGLDSSVVDQANQALNALPVPESIGELMINKRGFLDQGIMGRAQRGFSDFDALSKSVGSNAPAFSMPALNLPSLNPAGSSAPASGGSQFITIRLESGSNSVTGQFKHGDLQAMLDTLKSAGMRTA